MKIDLSEKEIRNVIRRRLVIEQLRYSKTQKMILFEQDGGVVDQAKQVVTKEITEKVLEEIGVPTDINKLLGGGEVNSDTLSNIITYAVGILGVGGSGYLAYTAWAAGGALLSLTGFAAYAVAALPLLLAGGYVWYDHSSKTEAEKIAKTLISNEDWEKYFTSRNPANELEKMLEKVIQSKELVIPKVNEENKANNPVAEKANELELVLKLSKPDAINLKKTDDGVEFSEAMAEASVGQLKELGKNNPGPKSSTDAVNDFLGIPLDTIKFGMSDEDITEVAEYIAKAIGGDDGSEPDEENVFEALAQCPLSNWEEIDTKVGELILESLAEAGETDQGLGIMGDKYKGRYSEEYNIYFPDGSSEDTLDHMGAGQVDMIDTTLGGKRDQNRLYSHQAFEGDVNNSNRSNSIILKMLYTPDYDYDDYDSFETVIDDLKSAYADKNDNTKYFHALIRTDQAGTLIDNYTQISDKKPDYAWEITGGLLMNKGLAVDARFIDELTDMGPETGFFEKIGEFFGKTWDSFKSWLSSWSEFFGEAWGGFKETITDIFDFDFAKIGEGISEVVSDFFINPLSAMWGWFTGVLGWFWDMLLKLFGFAKKKVNDVISYVKGDDDSGSGDADDDQTKKPGGRKNSGAGRGRGRRYRPAVDEMQRTLNAIIDAKGIDVNPTNPDGIWGSDTDRVWGAVLQNEFSDVFPDDGDITSFKDWQGMSKKLNDDKGTKYPQYSSDAKGALKIISDIAEKNEITVQRSTGRLDRGAGTGGELDYSPGRSQPELSRGTAGRGTSDSYGAGYDISISVDSGNLGGKTLEAIGFPDGTSEDVSEAIARTIKSENFTGGIVQFEIQYAKTEDLGRKKGEIIRVKKDRAQSRIELTNFRGIKNSIKKKLISRDRQFGNRLKVASGDKDKTTRKSRLGGHVGTFTLIANIKRTGRR